MGIKIGNGNKINNSVIAEKTEGDATPKKVNFFYRHPWISTIVITFIVGFILLLSFWKNIIKLIEGLV